MTGTSELIEPGEVDAPEHLDLASAFPDVTREQWTALVSGVLSKGGAVISPDAAVARLTSTTLDGISVAPLYTSAPGDPGLPGMAPYLRGATPAVNATGGWDVRARFTAAGADAAQAAETIETDLENGVTSLWLVLGDQPGALAVGDLPALLGGVYLDLAPIVLDAGSETASAATALLDIAAQRGIAAPDLAAVLGADPIGLAARTGDAPDYTALIELAQTALAGYPKIRAGVVDATIHHEAGASDAQQLALALATGVAYLRELTAAGLSVADAAAQLEFRYSVTDEQFPSIALLRAARRLWSQVTRSSGIEAGAPQAQHAVTSWAMLTRHDASVNILRGTLAAFAAGVGGASAITVLPYDYATAADGAETVLSRRIARNTSTLLIEESNIGRVVDPGGGSWYIETLTDDLAKAAWAIFQQIEAQGGIVRALDSGWVRDALAATRAVRDKRLAQRRDPITGVSEFPNLAEPAPGGAATLDPDAGPGPGLPRLRYSQSYETLRDRSDAHRRLTGTLPTVVLATIGSTRDSSARVGFATGALAPGGIDVVLADAADPGALAEAFAAAGSTTACLCSSDKLYAEQAVVAARALTAAGATTILLAGRPAKDLEAGFREAGISGFLFMGSDIVAALTDILDGSGVR